MQKIQNLLTYNFDQTLRPLPAPQVKLSRARVSSVSPVFSLILKDLRRELSSINAEQITEDLLQELITKIATRLGFQLSSLERDELLTQIEVENKPFGVLQPFVDDREISDIIVSDAGKISVQCGRRTLHTDTTFPDQAAYENFVERLLQHAGTTYSTRRPIADGMIGSFARIHAVHRSLCESGPYLTIRLNRMSQVGIKDLIQRGLAPAAIFSYLEKIVQAGLTVFVVGEVGTGKTTLVRALASLMPPEDSILVIEDTPEIRLEHPQVRYVTTREVNSEGIGRVSPSECIRAGMRMAMNRIIFGEIRDAEAAEAFIDVCASGHPGLSTIHARSASESITRLELFLGRAQRGVSRAVLSEQITTAVQVIVYIGICPCTGQRRIFDVKEIGPVADGVIRQRDLFRYHPENADAAWRVVTRSSGYREILEDSEPAVRLSSYPGVLKLEQRENISLRSHLQGEV